MTINRFTISIPLNAEEVRFDFHPVNIRDKQLYQVYADHESRNCRFHMQINKEGEFAITDKNNCPKAFHELESRFSDAIIAS